MQIRGFKDQIRDALQSVPKPLGKAKCGKQLHEDIAAELRKVTSFRIVKEDPAQFLQARMPVWRDKHSDEIVPTINRRKIDIVVYDGNTPIALVEVESDLDDLQPTGVSRRKGHYDVFSIAKSADGFHFHSYKSLERMAAASIYRHLHERDGIYPSTKQAIEHLNALNSDNPDDHNPSQLPMFLVCGSCRNSEILGARLGSLGAELICAR